MTGRATAPPVIVFGALRSGSTLLRLMLDANTNISCPAETDFMFDHLLPDARSYRYDLSALQSDRMYRAFEERYKADEMSPPTPERFLDQISENGAKTAVLVLHRGLSKALDVFPDARIIHLVRDPRDVARSSVGMGWAGHVYFGVDHWINTENEWHACQPQVAQTQSMTIQYEGLITAPEDTLSTISAFCGEDYDPKMLDYNLKSTYSKPDPTLIFQWKHKQTSDEVSLVEQKIGTLLSTSGYTASGYLSAVPSTAKKLSLWAINKRGVWRFRFKRYGVYDTLVSFLSRRLHIAPLGRRAKQRMEAADIKNLK
ncbi:hypothetical protein AN191_01695 [Loktanella sp. 5RATIMAR09]|uniref:sulfotransferase family protein n=1 Tax=Loktanella sp. 5RATIMAR09 TaxID=1225655 RepID=UPI0007079C2F|nr:sulfotransferase [Loktanella sp. 5RATIMAR09]KQI73618.1 hypothetical protein AN191_01695 [Loktanella sp. 5RATIMAR09]